MAHKMPKTPLANPPLSLVLTAIRYQPEPSWGRQVVADIRKHFRDEYPVYSSEQQPAWQLGPDGAKQLETESVETFLSEDYQRGFSISRDNIALFDSHYTSHPKFAEFVGSVLPSIEEYIGITLYSRIGLRYIDTIMPSEGKEIEYYIEEPLKKYCPQMLNASPYFSHLKSNFLSTIGGTLVLQAYHVDKGEVVPPDLRNVTNKLKLRTAKQAEGFFVLDTDHYIEHTEMKRFASDTALTTLGELHEEADRLFFSSVTDEAVELWS